MVRGIARDVGTEVDQDVALVAGVIVVGVDAGNGIAKAAVLLDAKPGARDDEQAVSVIHLAADAGRECETTGASVEVGKGEGNGGIEVVPGKTCCGTLRELDGIIGSLHFALGQMQAADLHVLFPLFIGHLTELGDLVTGFVVVLEFSRSGAEGELGFLFGSGFGRLGGFGDLSGFGFCCLLGFCHCNSPLFLKSVQHNNEHDDLYNDRCEKKVGKKHSGCLLLLVYRPCGASHSCSTSAGMSVTF